MNPPPPPREFRGVWVATVNNIDWPSRPGLTTAEQQTELLALLDRAVELRLNAIVFQVRPACDAFYASSLEPWSEYLTGEMGRPPRPFYDPLQFAVEEAHRRGLELHAWFNPFRARHGGSKSVVSPTHVVRTHAPSVRSYGSELWLDPGERSAQDHTMAVMLDVVRRYDIDGVHLDDYFYPYPEKDSRGVEAGFPDEATWARYQRSGGRLGRSDWRRNNIDLFVQRLYREIKGQKTWVKVGISPFGIWRPGFPASARGLDAYEKLYADSRRWLSQGWLDYCAPQLYWSIDSPGQSYAELLPWWREQNTRHRHVWPGNSVYRAAEQPGELTAQIRFTRRNTQAPGNLLWSMKTLQQDKGGVATELARTVYQQPALVPAFGWLDVRSPARPRLTAAAAKDGWRFSWQPAAGESAWLWLVQSKSTQGWTMEIRPASRNALDFGPASRRPALFAVRGVDRCGNMSPAAVLERRDE
jgi:uncharacterized lipoprotein YddW (UPF0748 family)